MSAKPLRQLTPNLAPSYTLAETRRKKIGLAKQNPLR
jgi:hypothetical protein